MALPPKRLSKRARAPELAERVLLSPLHCYRIGDPRFPLMDGAGAALIGGRWNSVGRPVVYASLSFGGALIEQLAHAGIGRLPPRIYVAIDVPGGFRVAEPDTNALAGWDRDDFVASRRIGHAWLESGRTVALIVPSKTGAPFERHVILNPRHADFPALVVSQPERLAWDARLHTRAARTT